HCPLQGTPHCSTTSPAWPTSSLPWRLNRRWRRDCPRLQAFTTETRSRMKDGYLDFANSSVGAKLVDALGLPKPLPLERYQAGQPVVQGTVLIGGNADSQ